MTSSVKVSGIPVNVPLNKLTLLFGHILSMRSGDFSLRLLPPRGKVKDVLLAVPTYSEAQLAREKLDNFVYEFNNATYVFTATLNISYNKNKKDGYPQNRSHAPHYEDTASQLDMQLEILRKQRMILEEERKLLEEQKKLEQLKMKAFSNESLNEGFSTNPLEKKSEPKLSFYQTAGMLMTKMKTFINKHSSSQERKALAAHVRSILKQRLAAVVAADGQGVFQTSKVMMLYRAQYPTSEDEEMVKEALQHVKKSQPNYNAKIVKASAGVNAKSMPDGTTSDARDQTLKEDNVTAKDTTLSGDLHISENTNNEDNKPRQGKFEEHRLFFHKSSGVILKKMNTCIDKHCPSEIRKEFIAFLRFSLKQRLAAVVGGQPIYYTQKIVKMYRSQHPPNTDEEFVKQLLRDMDEGSEAFIKFKNKDLEEDVAPDQDQNEKIVTDKQASDEPGQPDKKNDNIVEEPLKLSLEMDDEKKNDESIICEVGDSNIPYGHCDQKLDESNTRNGSNANDVEIIHVDVFNCNTDNNKSDITNPIVDKEIKMDFEATQASPHSSEYMKLNADECRGIKRNNDDDDVDCSEVKKAKTDDVSVIGPAESQRGE